MQDIRIVRPLGFLSGRAEGWRKELNAVYAGDERPAYDIREWNADHSEYRNGITLDEAEAAALLADLARCFRRSAPARKPDDSSVAETAQRPDILDILKEKDLLFADRRKTGGVLWVFGGRELDGRMIALKQMGYYFTFVEKGGKATDYHPAWYLKYINETPL